MDEDRKRYALTTKFTFDGPDEEACTAEFDDLDEVTDEFDGNPLIDQVLTEALGQGYAIDWDAADPVANEGIVLHVEADDGSYVLLVDREVSL